MPHVTLEYSANLEGRLDIAELCRVVRKAAGSTGVLDADATRVRALRCDHYAVADEHPDNGFVDGVVRIGQKGRTHEERRLTGKAIYDAMRAYCAPLFETHYFALSLEIREIDDVLSWKENGIKPRLPPKR